MQALNMTSAHDHFITFSQVKYWRQGESMNVAKLADAEKKTTMKIHGLDSDTVYNVRVYGYSRGGEGLSSSPTVHFILG